MIGQSDMTKEKRNTYTAGIYCRLSNDDEDNDSDDTSVSINTQKQICTDFCHRNGIRVYDIFVDDGWTGTNFERPDFRRLIKAVEDGKINAVVVKDLSRFGRNYLETGTYITQYFPQKNVRFIAINDDVDSSKGSVDYDLLFPIRNIFNEYYPADCSKKTRLALSSKAKNGEYIGSYAPYGYRKSAEDKHVLEIDPVAAPTVRRIFEWLAHNGYGFGKIAKMLEAEKLPKPEAYRAELLGKQYSGERYEWNLCSVRAIVNNEVYLGHLVSGKRRKLSFKSKAIITVPEEEQIIVKDVFPRIISDELWEEAHRAAASRKRDTPSGFDNIFAGILRCADCGYAMGISTGKSGREATYNCEQYKKKGSGRCHNHYVKYAVIYDAVLKDVRRVWDDVTQDRAEFLKMTEEKVRAEITGAESRESARREIGMLKEKFPKLDQRIASYYDDRFNGTISEQTFSALVRAAEAEREETEKRISRLENTLTEIREAEAEAERFVDAIAGYAGIEKLDRELLHRLIERIEVGSQKDENGNTRISLNIVYKFVGEIA